MTKHLLIVVTNPVPGREQEFNRWYDGQHLDDVLKLPGFVAAQRFKLTMDSAQSLPGPYLAIYEIDADDLDVVQRTLSTAAKGMEISAALDRSTTATYTYRLLTETTSGA